MKISTGFFLLLPIICWLLTRWIAQVPSSDKDSRKSEQCDWRNIPKVPPVDAIITIPWDGGHCIYDPRYQSHPRLINLWDPKDQSVFRVELETLLSTYGSLFVLLIKPGLEGEIHEKYLSWLHGATEEELLEQEYIYTNNPYRIENRKADKELYKIAEHQKSGWGASERALSGIRMRGTCKACEGTGYIQGYSHVEGGRCFSCNGNGS